MEPVNMQTRLQAVIPEEVTVQKCKCKGPTKEPREERLERRVPVDLCVDIVVNAIADLPSGKSFTLTRVKNVSLSELAEKKDFRTEGLILDKSIKATPAEVEALKTAWGVKEVFDLSGKSDKKEVKKAKREFQEKHSGDMNKLVINPKSDESKKAKVTFSEKYLETVLDGVEKKEGRFGQVTSWKFCLDFTGVKKEVFDRFRDCVKTGKFQKVKATKSEFTAEQKAELPSEVTERKKKAEKAPKESSSE